MLFTWGDRCMTTRNAACKFGMSNAKRRRRVSTPPAEVPITTMSQQARKERLRARLFVGLFRLGLLIALFAIESLLLIASFRGWRCQWWYSPGIKVTAICELGREN